MLALAAARLSLGLITSRDLPAVAVDALAAGRDSPSLRRLAGLTGLDVDEARALFARALAELDVVVVSGREAVMLVARDVAAAILDGRTTARAGAERLWDLSSAGDEHIDELDAFVYAASEWRERPEDATRFENGVRAAARALLV